MDWEAIRPLPFPGRDSSENKSVRIMFLGGVEFSGSEGGAFE